MKTNDMVKHGAAASAKAPSADWTIDQGWAGYRNEAARGGTVDPRRRVTHSPEKTA